MSQTIATFLALITAHILADSLLQSETIKQEKRRGLRRGFLRGHSRHALIHYICTAACLSIFVSLRQFTRLNTYLLLAGLVLAHMVIDLLRVRFADDITTFVGSQALHIATVAFITVLLTWPQWPALDPLYAWVTISRDKLLLSTAIYASFIFGAGNANQYLLRLLKTPQSSTLISTPHSPVVSAGLYIGWLERFLVITAVLCRSPQAVGLILTAKSIARFPELKDQSFAEYFLLGTLLSVAEAFAGGLLLVRLLYGSIALH
jgi:hypothetical protein